MTRGAAANRLGEVRGLRWAANGSATLSGELLRYAERLDRCFLAFARRWEPAEVRFPAVVPAADLDGIDYFRSFPHLATFATSLDAGVDNLNAFRAGQPVAADGHLRLTGLAPVRDVLTPAACYPVYSLCAGEWLAAPRHFTTSSTCFRRETHYVPLERQWTFTMREVVCLGTADEVRAFRDAVTGDINAFIAALGLPLTWDTATDPFFQPARNPRHLMQQVAPTKHELLFDGRLAIASANLHHDAFGRAYAIQGIDGLPVHSACVAFGLERWLATLAHCFGPDPVSWPDVEAPAARALWPAAPRRTRPAPAKDAE